MTSLILRTTARYLLSLLLVFSLFLLIRGHNAPGGGFVGGLVVAAAFSLYVLAYDVASARRALWFDPHTLIASGLAIAALSGVAGSMRGEPFLKGLWQTFSLKSGEQLHLGTPLLFDIGVYVVVVGVTLNIVFSLAEE